MAYGAPWCRDGISIRDLQLQAPPHHALDAWGREKEQPVLLSVHLAFKSGFDSAANNDALDASTMHYGILAKGLRGLVPQEGWRSVDNLAQLVHDKISSMLPGPDLLDSLAIEIKMPKASLLGESVVFHRFYDHGVVQDTMHLVNVCLPTLIGVNSNERNAKQKLVVNLWIGGLKGKDCDSYTELEQILTKVGSTITAIVCRLSNYVLDHRTD